MVWFFFLGWFPSFELAFHWCLSRWRRVWCSNTHTVLTNIYTKGPLHGGWHRGRYGLVLPFPTFASGLWHTRKPQVFPHLSSVKLLDVFGHFTVAAPASCSFETWFMVEVIEYGGADCFSIPAPAAPRAADKYGRQYIRVYNPRTYQNLALI